MRKVISILSLLLLVAGIGLVGYSVYEIWDTNRQQDLALKEAEEILDSKPNEEAVKEVVIPTFNKGDTVGILEVPKLEEKLPIIEGTDAKELRKGVGHYIGTVLPTQNDQIVLSGHRDTVFKKFKNLELGDRFIVKMEYGDFTYEIYETEIVEADDTTVIRSTAPEEILTVTTCYPFDFLGDAPQRFIFYAKKVEGA